MECYTMAKITLGSKVAVSQRTFLCTGSHVISSLTRELITKPISIQDHVWVAAEAYIGPGVTIKRGAVVGARAVVAKDVDEWQILVGNPAQVVGLRKLKEEL
ncbi:hypothetical protein M0C34_18910 [Agarivorans sp. TSD2052]|uniref:hypothetical protein n=1 Tax=Agarivorans sp. TSD2052 TaxID=2937286 RepID=UPI00200E110F|nr:hypothetical protein [Agarivorans sp. TSD2052]UPW18268.1 hypothetical protein M0C34_18910 [Agarivorans sp. TSD2052]